VSVDDDRQIFDSLYEDENISDLVKSFFDDNTDSGINNTTTIMAYGQSGAGKTYTINRLITQVIQDLFSKFDVDDVKCSYYQIYNEKIYDLIMKDVKNKNYKFLSKDLKIKMMRDRNYGVDGLSHVKCKTNKQLMHLYTRSSK
jgi:Cdc6-like AAA superfamily ATPase